MPFGQHGELKNKRLVSKIIKWVPEQWRMFYTWNCNYKALTNLPWGKVTWSSAFRSGRFWYLRKQDAFPLCSPFFPGETSYSPFITTTQGSSIPEFHGNMCMLGLLLSTDCVRDEGARQERSLLSRGPDKRKSDVPWQGFRWSILFISQCPPPFDYYMSPGTGRRFNLL